MMKMRLDELLVRKNYFSSRTRAQAYIRAGRVVVDNKCADKPGKEYPRESEVIVKKDPYEYVSRGAYKLKPALDYYNLSLEGKAVMDVGASTGGFTQLLLKRGARRVYAVDVGRGQLDWSLRNDKRVCSIEEYNARYFKRTECIQDEDEVFLVTIDVSFISLSLILPPLVKELPECQWFFLLVKPQFEAPRKDCHGGVVKNKDVIQSVLNKIHELILIQGLKLLKTFPSPVKGPRGNQEYMMVCSR